MKNKLIHYHCPDYLMLTGTEINSLALAISASRSYWFV
jgi:hypothetical protein